METIEPAECIGVGDQPIWSGQISVTTSSPCSFSFPTLIVEWFPIFVKIMLFKNVAGNMSGIPTAVYRRGRRTVICFCRDSTLAISCSIFVSIIRMDSRNGLPPGFAYAISGLLDRPIQTGTTDGIACTKFLSTIAGSLARIAISIVITVN